MPLRVMVRSGWEWDLTFYDLRREKVVMRTKFGDEKANWLEIWMVEERSTGIWHRAL